MNLRQKYFEDSILEFKNEIDEVVSKIAEINDSMKECIDAIVEIKEKYDYYSKEKMLFNLECKSNELTEKRIAFKVRYICNIIYECIKSEILSEAMFMRFLCEKFGFTYGHGSMYSYEDFFNNVFVDSSFDYDDVSHYMGKFEVKYVWYFRGYQDDEISIGIPESILGNIDGFITALENKMLEEKNRIESEKKRKEDEAKEARYQSYLKLKEEFE